ncbi:MAG: class I SAM-dependent methyltransferase [Trueperaceae bacterium]|nr:class I SAM-dependent methyltransferase [Trueperaceae bacterium]
MAEPSTWERIAGAIAARAPWIDAAHAGALRLFHGHLEGDPRVVIDAYGRTAVVAFQGGPGDRDDLATLVAALPAHLPWLRAIVVKERDGASDTARRGRVAWAAPGAAPDTEVLEHGVRYALDLLLNQDAGFYLDTRELRRWLLEHSEGRTVLNTFAYTGSLGVAARAGGATRVVHTDRSARFLAVAQASTALNGFAVDRRDFVARDFFSFVRGAKLRGERYDTVVLDPPFFSSTEHGALDLNRDTARMVNKVRPLVASGGRLVVVNNALYLSGVDFLLELDRLCAGGWMTVEALVGVPPDVTGTPATRVGAPPVDPAPFAHSTKIAVLGVRHR